MNESSIVIGHLVKKHLIVVLNDSTPRIEKGSFRTTRFFGTGKTTIINIPTNAQKNCEEVVEDGIIMQEGI